MDIVFQLIVVKVEELYVEILLIQLVIKTAQFIAKKKNSCCFYKYTYKNPDEDDWQTETNCIWLGTGDIGEMSYNKLTIICFSNYMKLNIIPLLLFFIFIL